MVSVNSGFGVGGARGGLIGLDNEFQARLPLQSIVSRIRFHARHIIIYFITGFYQEVYNYCFYNQQSVSRGM